MSSVALVTARSVYAQKNAIVIDLQAKLKEALAVRAVAAKAVQVEAARDAKAKIRSMLAPVAKVKEVKGKTAKTVKGKICKKVVSFRPADVPAVTAKRGRPALSSCNGCRRLAMGCTSLGRGHTCGKVKWAR